MKSKLTRLVVVASLGMAVTACGGSGTIFKTFELTNDESVMTGARQRGIFNIPVGAGSVPGQVNPNRVVCAEPSPDVALAVANSFGLGVSIVSQGSGSVTRSEAEGIAQLAERVATIQLLRDGLYRACEAYANGAISSTEYSVIVSGIDDTMVTLLLGELAAGAFGRKLAAIGTEAAASANASLTQALTDLKGAADAADQAKAAQDKVDTQTKTTKEAMATAKTTGDPKDKAKAREEEKKLAKAEEERDEKTADLQVKLATAATSSAKASTVIAGGGITAKPSAELAAEIRVMQKNFLGRSKTDALMVACISELSRSPLIPSSENSAEALGAAFGNLAEKLGAWEEAWKSYVGNSNEETKSVLKRAEDALLTAVQRADVSSLAYKCMTVMTEVLEAKKEQAKKRHTLEERKLAIVLEKHKLTIDAEKEQAKNRHTLEERKLTIVLEKHKLTIDAEKDRSHAIAELARLCRIKTPTAEQKAACAVLTKVFTKINHKGGEPTNRQSGFIDREGAPEFVFAVKAQHAADTVVRQISTKKTKKDAVGEFCIDLAKKGANADKDTMIACVEALGGL